jgi:hypothetical protein
VAQDVLEHSETETAESVEAEIGPIDPRKATRNWRIWVTRHPIAGSLLSGFVATHILTTFAFWLPGIGLPQLDWPISNGNVVLPTASPAVKFVIGEVFIHGLDGVVFTLIYAIVVYPLLSPLFRNRVTPAANMGKAVLFGLVLGTIACGFLTPYVYAPHAGAGIFSTGFGWKEPFAIYLSHMVYAVNLGMLYNPIVIRNKGR